MFVNRSLTLENIKCYGFDMDYTLAGESVYSAVGKSCQTMCEVLRSHPLFCFEQCISLQSMRVWALSCSGTGWCQSDTHTSCWATRTTPPSPRGKCCSLNGSGLGYIGSVSSWLRLLRLAVCVHTTLTMFTCTLFPIIHIPVKGTVHPKIKIVSVKLVQTCVSFSLLLSMKEDYEECG